MNAGLPFVFACCAGTSGAPKADVQFYGSLFTYVKRYSVMMNNNISSDGKARLSSSTLGRHAKPGDNIEYYVHPI